MEEPIPPQPYDAITFSILWARLLALVDEAGATLQRTSFSTVSRESNDFAVVLMDAQGNSMAQSTTSIPSFLVVLPMLTKALLAEYFPADTWREGDVVITNDPWLCAGNKPDIGLVSPIFRKQTDRGGTKLVGFIGCIAHSPDMGGVLWGAGARDFYEEGLLIPPTKLYDAGKPNELLFSLISANVRAAQQTLGDIRAQVAANEQGIRSLMRMMDENQLDNLENLAVQLISTSERAMRDAIRKAPDGHYQYDYKADGDGLAEPVHIRCTVSIDGDVISVDYDGTSGVHSLAINAVLNYTYAYTAYAIKCVFSPEVPSNEGAFRPIRVTAPQGSILNARRPAPLGGRNMTGNLLHAPVFGALAQAVPELVQADCGSACWCIVLNGPKDYPVSRADQPKSRLTENRKDEFVEYVFLNGGYGARPTMDGINTLSFPTNVANVPIEVLERKAPIIVTEKSLRPGTGGAGKYRGGLGQTFSFRLVGQEPINISLLTEKLNTVAHGMLGGQNGQGGELLITPERFLPPKGIAKLYPGDEITVKLPGGGGYGPVSERVPAAIEKDQRLGYC
ncbi:hydantoinase B/oxoprolinase family protein [Spirosoma taeanense]|uniref:Hydantoinase B/oxoprolinase family protein n=1 Tax=Spirosoma taeanense TaxID=2735870 RepID=A0A6M5YBG8_9BACT|nr:hydantoinase B/oxoprolinase family protein [Spirosoma taeanense]QJW90620.1 hydantoinase B/oxoprolinase family protein [Spirosoma taeanense]